MTVAAATHYTYTPIGYSAFTARTTVHNIEHYIGNAKRNFACFAEFAATGIYRRLTGVENARGDYARHRRSRGRWRRPVKIT